MQFELIALIVNSEINGERERARKNKKHSNEISAKYS